MVDAKDASWRIELLGGLRLLRDGCEPIQLPPQHAFSLLAFLALNPSRVYTRDELIDQLWPDEEPERARQRLRRNLHALHRQLEQPPLAGAEILRSTRAGVCLNQAVASTDVADLEGALHEASQTIDPAERKRLLSDAIVLYRGELLPGFYDPCFDGPRGRLADLYSSALHSLTLASEQAGDIAVAIEAARLALAVDPLVEEAHFALMRLYAENGQPSAVQRQFQELEHLLQAELGEAHSPAARELAESLRRGATERAAQAANLTIANQAPADAPLSTHDGTVPTILKHAPVADESAAPRISRKPSRLRFAAAAAGCAALGLAAAFWTIGHRPARKSRGATVAQRIYLPQPPLRVANTAAVHPPTQPSTPPRPVVTRARPAGVGPALASSALPAAKSTAPRPAVRKSVAEVSRVRDARLLWAVQYQAAADETGGHPTAMSVDPDGNIYLTGFVGTTRNDADFLTLKYSPDGRLLWRARYNGPGNDVDRARSIAVDKQGNVLVNGESDNGKGNGLTRLCGVDYATIKYDRHGRQLWVDRYNGADDGEDWPRKICVDHTGCVYVTGYSDVTRQRDGKDYACKAWMTLKYAPDGRRLWIRGEHNWPDSDREFDAEPIDMVLASNGDLLIAGNLQVNIHNGQNGDIVTRRYSPDGHPVWMRRFGRPDNAGEYVTRLSVDRADNVYVTGTTKRKEEDINTQDILVLKYDSFGNQQWVRLFDHEQLRDEPHSLAVDPAGNAFICGASDTWDHEMDAAILKYGPKGDLQRERFFNGLGDHTDAIRSADIDSKGRPVFAGFTYDPDTHAGGRGYRFLTLKFDANGRPLWRGCYGGVNSWFHADGYPVYLAIDRLDNVIVAGTLRTSSNTWSITLLKYAP